MDLPPGTVMLCPGTGPVAWVIRWWTGLFAHVQIISSWRGRPAIWESTALTKQPCEAAERVVDGVQVHYVHRLVSCEFGSFWVRRLPAVQVWVMTPKTPLTLAEQARLLDCLESHLGRPYDFAGAGLAGSIWLRKCGLGRWLASIRNHIFCSELVVDAMQHTLGDRVPSVEPGTIQPAEIPELFETTHNPPVLLR